MEPAAKLEATKTNGVLLPPKVWQRGVPTCLGRCCERTYSALQNIPLGHQARSGCTSADCDPRGGVKTGFLVVAK